MYNLSQLDNALFNFQNTLSQIRTTTRNFAATPSEKNGESLATALNNFDKEVDSLKNLLTVVIKNIASMDESDITNDDNDGMTVEIEETENGFKL